MSAKGIPINIGMLLKYAQNTRFINNYICIYKPEFQLLKAAMSRQKLNRVECAGNTVKQLGYKGNFWEIEIHTWLLPSLLQKTDGCGWPWAEQVNVVTPLTATLRSSGLTMKSGGAATKSKNA